MPTKTPTKTVAKKAAASKPKAQTNGRGAGRSAVYDPTNRGGRPRTYDGDRRQIQIRLPEDLRERLDNEADRRRVSKNYLIERLISDGLPEYERQKIDL